MSEQPPNPPSDPNLPPFGGYGTPPPPPPGGYGTPPPPPPPSYGSYGAPPSGAQPYDVIEAIKYGWSKFAQNVGPFLLMGLLTLVVVGVLSTIGSVLGGDFDTSGNQYGVSAGFGAGFSFFGTLFNILANIAGVFLTAALTRGALDAAEGRKVEIGAMFTRWNAGQVLVLAILVGIGTMIGFILCILPGLVLTFFTWFANYFVVGEGQGAIDAIKSSFRFTADNIGNLILLFLLSVVIVILGACACLVGLLVAMPVITIAGAFTFKVLRGQPVAP